ncbi:hypothetical protein [Nostoc sp.]|uniref:hypothetical protein n=1 Tax=Nostoc sp. TaxID=1180 RepID=UPI002FF4EA2D
MQIKTFHAHFLLQTDSSNQERIGFSVILDEDETPEQVVPILRQKAINIVGKKAYDFYQDRRILRDECNHLEKKLELLRKEWDATAEFLKAQGLNPTAPSMPQFRNLLTAVTVESEVIHDVNDEEDDYDSEDEDDYDEEM